jgi:AP-4 complex subunit mu-1
MKSYLVGNPILRLALNEDMAIGRTAHNSGMASVVLDDCNFHESVNLSEFEDFKLLTIRPPDGEFTVMNYRINGEFTSPFRIFPFKDIISQFKVELLIKVRACFPEANYGANVVVSFKVPRNATKVTPELTKGAVG